MTDIIFTVPDIYPVFSCKISSCRQSCCKGWEITVSMNDYFKLVGLGCSRSLRRRLDGSLYILDHPTPERYAAFIKTFDGDCPMHDGDGYCALQRGCGEKVLTSVCRYYPRSPRTVHGYECALSASCEAVCELLFSKKEPLGFIRLPLSFELPLPNPHDDIITRYYAQVRRIFISILQNRSVPLSSRIAQAGDVAVILDKPFLVKSESEIEAALKEALSVVPRQTHTDIPDIRALTIISKLLNCFEERHAIYDYAEEAKNNLGLDSAPDEKTLARCISAASDFSKRFPDNQIILEQLLVHHVFYSGFPFSDERESIYADFASLCALCALWEILAVGYSETHSNTSDLVDMTAVAFRLIENSNFDLRAAALLARENFMSPSDLASLACLL